MEKINENELFCTIEALLFVSGDPVHIAKLSEVLEIGIDELGKIMHKMISKYNFQRRGMKLIMLDNSYQLVTRPEYFDYAVKLVTSKHKNALTAANLEVLSVIAYNQPVTKAAIEQVRGVDSSYSISKLLERDLIAQKGRLDAPGKPMLYVTTDEFLRCFGLTSLDDMPELESEFEKLGLGKEKAENVTFEEISNDSEINSDGSE
ncbi:MAG: SMC-Scp complex subunit ScpB [Clostridia bacterium]|nr:SMC-Scp complex subunit ScpB [Clostridia bacterium]